MPMNPTQTRALRALTALLAMALAAPLAGAQAEPRGFRGERNDRAEREDDKPRAPRADQGPRNDGRERAEGRSRGDGREPAARGERGSRDDSEGREERAERPGRGDRTDRVDRTDRSGRDQRPPPTVQREPATAGFRNDRRWDYRSGHDHRVIPPGRVVVLPPRPPPPLWWRGVSYRHWDGIWVTSSPRGWITVRPPIGIVVHDLPTFRTALVIGGLTYLYVNGIYYRERDEGGYEVAAPPIPDEPPLERLFIYPREGQSAEQQASDEYECHRWAVEQTGFDPTGVATGQTNTVSTTRRDNYQRASAACLDGRGYTVR